MKIVLDTNCLIPILMPGSYGYDIWQAFRKGQYTLCVSTEILFEYEEILMQITGDREILRNHWDFRQARETSGTGIYHVMFRGINLQNR